jgi:protein-S-isoprenylcysteine O-methyltransferase Ste14
LSTVLQAASKLLVGIAIFVGLPLVGWGLGDIPSFFSKPARLTYVVLVIVLQLLVVIRMPSVGRNRGPGTRTIRRQQVAVLLLQVLSLAIVLVAPFSDRGGIAVLAGLELLRYLGLVLFALGFVTVSWAESSLGKQFSVQVTVQEDHVLVTGGPYRHLRHPRYLGILVFNMGFSLIFRSWLALILVAALTLVLLWRIHDEEEFMHETFGSDWVAYTRRSSRLIPFLY